MIGDRIKEARLALGYSAEQVAEFLHVSPATVYRYENGDISKLPSKYVKPLADFLCITPSYLMGWEETPKPLKNIGLQFFSEDEVPHTVEARSLAKGIDRMPKEQREAILNMMMGLYPGLFEKGTDPDDT